MLKDHKMKPILPERLQLGTIGYAQLLLTFLINSIGETRLQH